MLFQEKLFFGKETPVLHFWISKTLPSVEVWYKLSSIEKGGAPFLSVGIGILFFFAYLIKSVLEFNFHILQGAIIFTLGSK